MSRTLNLLTDRFRLRMLLRRRLRQWGAVCAVVGAVSLGWTGWRVLDVRALHAQLTDRQAVAAPLARMQGESRRIQKQLDVLNRRQSLLALLEQGKLPYQVVAVISRSTRQCEGQVQVRELLLSRHQVEKPAAAAPSGRPTAAKPETMERILLTLKGVAADNLAVARFVTALRESAAFEHVDLRSAAEDGHPLLPAGRSYWVECTLDTL